MWRPEMLIVGAWYSMGHYKVIASHLRCLHEIQILMEVTSYCPQVLMVVMFNFP
jgi:hypothetical protein